MNLSLPLRIHSWGGFGSQLNALAFALEIQNRDFCRPLEIVIHTGGVTERKPEILGLIPDLIRHSVQEDFRPSSQLVKNTTSIRTKLSKILNFLKVLRKDIGDFTSIEIKPWTLSIRGHYSYFRYSKPVIDELISILSIDLNCNDFRQSKVVHYRLGDLLHLEKEYVGPEMLIQVMTSIDLSDWKILTDSPQQAQEMFQKVGAPIKSVSFKCIDSILVIQAGVSAKYFIGTSSKISIWISLFRTHLNMGNTYMPKSMKFGMQQMMDESSIHNIHFY